MTRARSAGRMGVGAAAAAAGGAKHGEYGEVPAYLRARQAEWAAAAEARKKAEEEADVPPVRAPRVRVRAPLPTPPLDPVASSQGMRLMPEAERLETLALLRSGIVEVQAELSRFKLRLVVPSQIARKGELESRLDKMEAAVGVFSKTKVLVKVE